LSKTRTTGRPGKGNVALGLLAGSVVFSAGDMALGRMGGGDRKHSGGRQADGSGPAIVLGTVLDWIPESMVLGLTVLTGGAVSVAFLVAVALSNVPEAVAASSGLSRSGWTTRRILGLWLLVTVVSGLASLVGFAAFDSASQSRPDRPARPPRDHDRAQGQELPAARAGHRHRARRSGSIATRLRLNGGYQLTQWCTFRRLKVVHFSAPLDSLSGARIATDATQDRLENDRIRRTAYLRRRPGRDASPSGLGP
jgi:hypothetical protein